MSIRYYSTNRHVNNVAGITPFTGNVSFKEALLAGQAPDEGLFVPDSIPQLSMNDIIALRDKPYWQAALLVAQAFLSDEFPQEVLETIVKDAYNLSRAAGSRLSAGVCYAPGSGAHGILQGFCRPDDGQADEPLPARRGEAQYSGGDVRRYRQRRG